PEPPPPPAPLPPHHLSQLAHLLPHGGLAAAALAEAADDLQHLLHLDELLEEPVDLLDRRPAAARDALAPAAVHLCVIVALVGGHRVDDRLDAIHLLLVDRAHRALELPHARQHPDDRLERSHLADGAELVAEV